MEKKLSILLVLTLMALCCSMGSVAESSASESHWSGDFRYVVLEDGTAEIIEYNGNETDLIIPEEIDSYRVTKVGDDEPFGYKKPLVSIAIPDSIEEIKAEQFVYCFSLKKISVSSNHPSLATIDGVLFSKADKRLICYPRAKKGTEYSIPQGIQIVGENAFEYCDLNAITIPDSVIRIEDGAFRGCDNLSSIIIPNSVTNVGNGVFRSCSGLTNVTIPEGITSIGECTFENCCSLESIIIPDSVTSIGENAFAYSAINSITIPDGVNKISSSSFVGCALLEKINVSPNHPCLASIEGVLFSKQDKSLICYPNGKKLEEYVIPEGVKAISDNAFEYCEDLISVKMPDSLTCIGENAFSNCSSLTSLIIPKSVTSIGKYAFFMCGFESGIILGLDTDVYQYLTLTVTKDSYAEQYCIENNIKYIYPDSLDWLNN